MGLFGLNKKDKVIDLGERMRKQQEQAVEMKEEASSKEDSQPASGLGFLSNIASTASSSSDSEDSGEYLDVSGGGDKKKKLAKRLIDMTSKIEDLSNQIYHLQQRIEVLERKSGVSSE